MPSDSGPTPPVPRAPATLPDTARPRLGPHLRLRFDRARRKDVLLGPESVIVLNATGAEIVRLCDGSRTVAEIMSQLRTRYEHPVDDAIRGFLARMTARHYLTVEEASDG